MQHRVEAQIDLAALKHNLQVVKSLAPQQAVLAMVKANGYGHGAVRVANALRDANAFGVASLDEALILRAANIKHPIVLMMGISSGEELHKVAEAKLELVIHHASQLRILEQTSLKKSVKVWLKIDTGMHRLGFPPEKVHAIYQQLQANHNVDPTIKLMTHLASAEDSAKNKITESQINNFFIITKDLAGEKSIANSAGIIAWPTAHVDWVRPGIMLYGVSPISLENTKTIHLRPAMTLQAKIIAINNLRRGDAIGYGGTWVCPEDMPVAIISIGYGDGYPRQMKSGAPVLIHNLRCSLVGRVSMDMTMVDLRACPTAKINDVVTLWGKDLPAEEVAPFADTIAYTLFCGVTQRVKISEING